MSEISTITKRGIIRGVAERFRQAYGASRHEKAWNSGKTRGEMVEALEALDTETCSAEAVNAIIGNASWTSNECDICGADVEVSVRIGDEPDYEARWVDICKPCAEKAVAAFGANPLPTKQG